jgi:Zn-dependent oligopeptidase
MQGDLGFLYLDLYSRKEKYPGCAHFAIRGGRKISESEYQLPVNISSAICLSLALLVLKKNCLLM